MDDKSATLTGRQYLTLSALCEYLSVSKWTIYRLINNREIPFVAIGKRVYRFDREAIDEWMKKNSMKTVAEV